MDVLTELLSLAGPFVGVGVERLIHGMASVRWSEQIRVGAVPQSRHMADRTKPPVMSPK